MTGNKIGEWNEAWVSGGDSLRDRFSTVTEEETIIFHIEEGAGVKILGSRPGYSEGKTSEALLSIKKEAVEAIDGMMSKMTSASPLPIDVAIRK